MKLKRRDFLGLAVKLTVTATIPSVLVACGGGGGGSEAATAPGLSTPSSIDSELASVSSQQASIDSTNNDLNTEQSQITNSGSATSAPGSIKSTAAVSPTTMYDFFSTRTPDYNNPALLSSGAHYLVTDSTAGTAFWQGQIDAHQRAYSQYEHQLVKLKAALRLFDSKIDSSEATSSTASTAKIKSTAMAVQILEPAEFDLVGALTSAISSILAGDLKDAAFSLLTAALEAVYSYLQGMVAGSSKYALSLLAQFAIDDLLEGLATKSIANLDFSDKEAIMLSLGKISVASIAIIGANKIQDVESTVTSDEENSLIEALLSTGDLASKMSMVWLGLINQLMGETFNTMNSSLTKAVAAETDSSIDLVSDKAALVTDLQNNSTMLATLSLMVKSLFSVFATQATDSYTDSDNIGFTSGSTAEQFSILFASEQNADDESLTGFTSTNIDAFTSMFSSLFTSTTKTDDYTALATSAQASVSTSALNTAATASVESDAFSFASQLAEFAYDFTSQTESDAVEFATHLADLAYQFTMDIEEDAFQFAMQGMEYGYLFASRGEEVGVMADRILWMAVQIGVMADRIGEMADRIVYTEQLIVYTEVLILDFGILIYGVVKQITNLILTGMALILDREWYSQDSEDIILQTISGNVSTMLSNMQEYSLAVLDNQVALRAATLDALDTVNFASTDPI